MMYHIYINIHTTKKYFNLKMLQVHTILLMRDIGHKNDFFLS